MLGEALREAAFETNVTIGLSAPDLVVRLAEDALAKFDASEFRDSRSKGIGRDGAEGEEGIGPIFASALGYACAIVKRYGRTGLTIGVGCRMELVGRIPVCLSNDCVVDVRTKF